MPTKDTRQGVTAPLGLRARLTRWSWVKQAAWTERMLAALEEARLPRRHAYFDALGCSPCTQLIRVPPNPDEDDKANHRLGCRMQRPSRPVRREGNCYGSPYPSQLLTTGLCILTAELCVTLLTCVCLFFPYHMSVLLLAEVRLSAVLCAGDTRCGQQVFNQRRGIQ